MKTLTPFVLLLTGGTILFYIRVDKKFNLYLWCGVTYLSTFIIEVVGVKTGFIFGNYSYGNVLGFSLFDVPLIIGFNWLLIIMAAINIAQSAEENIFLVALLAATLAVVFDLILEPVAIKLNYWHWEENLIPLKNYYSWFFITFCLSILASIMKITFTSIFLEHYYIVQFTFFILLLVLI